MFGKHAHRGAKVMKDPMNGRLVRAIEPGGAQLRILVDGEPVVANAGESVLVAVLAARNALRRHEFGDEPRAGFCLMGACQDCWVWLADHARVRACTTIITDGISIFTRPPEFAPRD